jgi:hypothetical protein
MRERADPRTSKQRESLNMATAHVPTLHEEVDIEFYRQYVAKFNDIPPYLYESYYHPKRKSNKLRNGPFGDLQGSFEQKLWDEIYRQKKASRAMQRYLGCISAGCKAKPPPVSPLAKHCLHESLVIQCKHNGDRHYELRLPGDPSQASGPAATVLEVVGGCRSTEDVISCAVVLKKGPCAEHKNRVFDLDPHFTLPDVFGDSDDIIKLSDKELQFKARALSMWPILWRNPGTFFWPAKPPTRRYLIVTNTCGQRLQAAVVVYPDIRWTVSLGVAFRERKEDQKQMFADMGSKRIVDKKYQLTAQVSCKSDKKTLNLTPAFRHYTDDAFRCINMGQWIADSIAPRLKEIGGVKVTLNWPVLGLSGSWGWQEIPKSPRCGFCYNVSLLADPLFGASGSVDILTWLLRMGGPIGEMINKVRFRLAEVDPDNTAGLGITLTLGGRVFGQFDYNKAAADPQGSCTGRLSGAVTLQLEAFIKAELEIKSLFVSAGAAAKVGGKAEVVASLEPGVDEHGTYLTGYVDFTGLKVYAAVAFTGLKKIKQKDRRRYYKIGFPDDGSPSFEELPPHYAHQGENEVEYKKEQVLIPPSRWGGQGKFYLLDAVEVVKRALVGPNQEDPDRRIP